MNIKGMRKVSQNWHLEQCFSAKSAQSPSCLPDADLGEKSKLPSQHLRYHKNQDVISDPLMNP